MSPNWDSTIIYHGPHAEFATVTGSPFWGRRIGEIIELFEARGWVLQSSERINTPYGMGPQVNHFNTPSGRDVLWIPSWGAVQGEEFFSAESTRRMYWILWQAGVKVVLVGGTSGSADWQDPDADTAVRPGDFVIPWSFYREQALTGTLPGTEMASGLLPRIALMADPFCTSLGKGIADRVRQQLCPAPFRRVHEPHSVKVSLHMPSGAGSFETDLEVLVWRSLTRLVSQDDGIPHVLLFGDCVSPVLARQMGIHMAYYHVPSNWAQGHPAERSTLTDPLNNLYLNVLPEVCLNLEADLLETWEIPEDCSCMANLKERPDVYMASMTPAQDE